MIKSDFLYYAAGLGLRSEIALPGLNADRALNAPEITVSSGGVPETFGQPGKMASNWELDADRLLLRIPGVARLLISGGREIRFVAEAGVRAEDVAIFIVGTALGILLHQRGRIVLHASAVRVGSHAVLFCGASGAGKSTLAAALNRCGFPVICDDVCAIDFGPDPTVTSDGRQLKLWQDAIAELGLDAARRSAVRDRLQKYHVEPGPVSSDPLPLGAIYALRELRPTQGAGIAKPNVVDAALLLRRNAYRPLLVEEMGQAAVYFRAAARIANAAGIYNLTRGLEFARMPEVIGWLERHWAEIGLAARAA